MTRLSTAVVALAAMAVGSAVARSSCVVDDNDKYDCGYNGIDETECESKGTDTIAAMWLRF